MSEDSQNSDEGGWIQWFCNLEDHFFFCEVDDEYIRDSFNLYGNNFTYSINIIIGLKQKFNNFNEALDMILSAETPTEEDLEDEKFLEIY